MPCYHPLHGYASKFVNPETGKRSWVSKLSKAVSAERLSIPCGRCIGCRLERSRQWAIRCLHEQQLHAESCFITLTYAPENLPFGGTLIKKHFQDFMKRLRKHFSGRKIKYFHCGEYGEQLARPHYHALIFGIDFADKEHFKNTYSGEKLYVSETLQRLWPFGFCTTGEVTFESAAYVARYCVKKVNGSEAERHYRVVDADGVVTYRIPEYTTMSLKSAIAKEWYERFKSDVFPLDEVIVRGKKMKPPKFYDRLLELEDPAAREAIRERRVREAEKRDADSSTRRLLDREQVKIAQTKQLRRSL